eukprot:365113-Chlamydomonas_euryale.AAC.1
MRVLPAAERVVRSGHRQRYKGGLNLALSWATWLSPNQKRFLPAAERVANAAAAGEAPRGEQCV